MASLYVTLRSRSRYRPLRYRFPFGKRRAPCQATRRAGGMESMERGAWRRFLSRPQRAHLDQAHLDQAHLDQADLSAADLTGLISEGPISTGRRPPRGPRAKANGAHARVMALVAGRSLAACTKLSRQLQSAQFAPQSRISTRR
jgi:Pentapeptide repeats (8 copies)